jgi:YebC/PmpR family DNA-binding regulatory protein
MLLRRLSPLKGGCSSCGISAPWRACAAAGALSRGLAGHSKWNNIKHKKEKNDGQKAVLNNRYARQLRVAAQQGGGPDPAENFWLDSLMRRAKKDGVPGHVVDNAIKAASGAGKDEVQLETVTYEASMGKGVLLLVDALTDNKRRAASAARHCFLKYGAKMEANVASFMFDTRGYFEVEIPDGQGEEDVALAALDAGALDYVRKVAAEEGAPPLPAIVVHTEVKNLILAAKALRTQGLAVTQEQIVKVPKAMVELTDEEELAALQGLVEMLEDVDDVSAVWTNVA